MNKTIPELVFEIVTKHYEEKAEGLLQSEIVVEVASMKGIPTLEANKIQPNVSKALTKFVKNNRLSKLEKGIYVPYNQTHSRLRDRDNICKTVVFTDEEIFPVSENTLLLCVKPDSAYIAKDLFKAYLGESRCFGVTPVGEYLALLLRGDSEELKNIRTDVEDIVKTAIVNYEKSTRKVLKLKKETK